MNGSGCHDHILGFFLHILSKSFGICPLAFKIKHKIKMSLVNDWKTLLSGVREWGGAITENAENMVSPVDQWETSFVEMQ